MEDKLAEGETRVDFEAGVLQRELETVEKMVKEKEAQLWSARQLEGESKDTIAALQKDVQLVEGQKKAADQQIEELMYKLLRVTRDFREAGKASAKEKEDLKRVLSESKIKIEKLRFAKRVVESDVEHKNRLIEELTLKNTELQKQLGMVQEVFHYTGIGSTVVQAQVEQQNKMKASENGDL